MNKYKIEEGESKESMISIIIYISIKILILFEYCLLLYDIKT